MDFSQKYHLIELLPGEGVQSYRARQANTGRDVTVHLLVGGKTAENEALLARLRAMQPQSLVKLIEVGEHQGVTFVVTAAPPYQRLDGWLAEQDHPAAVAKEFGKAGIWKRPETGSPASPAAPGPPVLAPRAPEPGEFTKQFQRPAAPVQEPGLPATSPVGGAAEMDEFAKIFAAPPASAAATQHSQAPPLVSEPGEFTRMFRSPVAPPAPEPSVPPVSAAATQHTPAAPQMPARPAATPAAEPSAPPVAVAATQHTPSQMTAHPAAAPTSEPGEFTRMF
ncbi:MAG: hypothetical protein NTW28_31300, partial [Candidatus Solibacter sp.]|nr:hypothetical protein [Candidatus Solibacter sp.]